MSVTLCGHAFFKKSIHKGLSSVELKMDPIMWWVFVHAFDVMEGSLQELFSRFSEATLTPTLEQTNIRYVIIDIQNSTIIFTETDCNSPWLRLYYIFVGFLWVNKSLKKTSSERRLGIPVLNHSNQKSASNWNFNFTTIAAIRGQIEYLFLENLMSGVGCRTNSTECCILFWW